MKNIKLALLFVVISSIAFISNSSQARGHSLGHNSQYVYATVLSAEPILKVFNVSEPEQQCFKQKVTVVEAAPASRTNRLLTIFLGAAIGNALGHNKTNKRVGTIAGAMLGSAIADDNTVRNSTYSSQQRVTRCETVFVKYQQQRVIGYRVTYLFEGETYTTRLKRDPGNSLRLRLSVTPMFD